MRHSHHANSLEAYHAGHLEGWFNEREQLILAAMKQLTVATDREVMAHCGFIELAKVQPRISDLVADGVLEECGSCESPETGIHVRKLRIAPKPALVAARPQPLSPLLVQPDLL